ncbi:MAG TPA: hypothetical protein VGY97_09635 [Solirubrobacteraceae bacterium]|jgi:hypothetical protein|nr:hypothetical protein [Solirubrobacteraceae bacterium]
MTGLTHKLRRRSAHLSALRAWETACADANQAYTRWSSDPTNEHYRDYLAADARATRARQLVGQRDPARSAGRRRAAANG